MDWLSGFLKELAWLWLGTAIVVGIASWIHNRLARSDREHLRLCSEQQKALSEEFAIRSDRRP